MPAFVTAARTTAAYDFGAIAIAFTSPDLEWLELLEQRYRAFRRSDVPSTAFRLTFAPEGALPQGLPSPLAAHLEAVEIERTPVGFQATTSSSVAEVSLEAGEAILRGPRAMYPLDNLLVQLLPVLSESSLLFHAAALAPRGAGLLAGGPSGAGKSTLAALMGDECLCDELAAVRRDGPGFRLVSLPFWAARPGDAALRAIALLAQADDHLLTPLTRSEALRSLSQLVLWPSASPAAMERCLSLLGAVLETVPVYELAFAPRSDVRSYLRKELS